jgi:hypothetical protein
MKLEAPQSHEGTKFLLKNTYFLVSLWLSNYYFRKDYNSESTFNILLGYYFLLHQIQV